MRHLVITRNVKWKLRIHTDWILHFSSPSALFLSLSTLPHLQKKRSRIKPTTAHHRHHHNILPIERGRRERKNLYVICILVKICFWWWRRRSSIVKCFRHIGEWESESVSNECARTRIIVKNRSSNTTKTKKNFLKWMRWDRRMSMRKRGFFYFKCNVNDN